MRLKEVTLKLATHQKLMELHGLPEPHRKAFEVFVGGLETSGLGLKPLLSKAQRGEYKLSEEHQTLLYDLLETGTFSAMDDLLAQTPAQVLDMLKLPGLGAKKVREIWKTLGVSTLEELRHKCIQGELAQLKGFGPKTQANTLEAVEFLMEAKPQLLFPEALLFAQAVEQELKDFIPDLKLHLVGDLKRNLPTLSKLEFAISKADKSRVFGTLDHHDLFEKDRSISSPFKWGGHLIDVLCPVVFHVLGAHQGLDLFKLSSAQEYLNAVLPSLPMGDYPSEKEVYKALKLPFIPSPLRELTNLPLVHSTDFSSEKVVKLTDLKGCLHNHSLYSDGQNTLAEMAGECKRLGLSYFGISDHSKTAFYAGGLYESDIIKQHQEIDQWNSKSPSFRIFKGIESDILSNGDLDYSDEVLASFDFIVSSIHANLTMNKTDATARLIKAIENPYTTILGHPTGRLLLRRKGYPIDHSKIIDACAANRVVIEINANPRRLDLDWQYIRQAAEKGVLLSINPDAHEVAGIQDMQYGVVLAQKAGLYPEQILNCLTLPDVAQRFNKA